MEIEKPNKTDLHKLNTIAKEVHDLHVKWRPDLFAKTDEPISEEYFMVLLENDEIYNCKDNNNIIGYVIIKEKESSNPVCISKKTIIIDTIAVKNEYRSKGIGRLLMNFVIELANKKGCDDIELTVSPENTNAIEFYAKCGMKVKNIKYQMWLIN